MTNELIQEVELLVDELMLSDDKVFAVERMMTASSLLRNLFRGLNDLGETNPNIEIIGLVETLNCRAEELLSDMTMPPDLQEKWGEHQQFCRRLGVAAVALGRE
jgi:hypothetical protein